MGRGTSYRVPSQVLKSLRDGKPYVHEEEPITNTYEFFDRFGKLVSEKNNNELDYNNLRSQTMEALDEIKTSLFATRLHKYRMDNDDTLLFIYMAYLFVENEDDHIMFHNIDDLYDDSEIPGWCKRGFRERNSALFEYGLIENDNNEGLACPDAWKLTDMAKEEVLEEINIKKVACSDDSLIKAETLTAKTLIYNDSEQKQISDLSSILSEARFKEVQERLRAEGMRPGFCCIFYGAPGTGKTETVYQIARQTGRDIMRVDVDKIKSCWVGESEKNIKSLFDKYRKICKHAKLAPILLFNEADAVLGVRMEGASRSVDKMENSIQNIILQEMETLDGIMIATTNLTSNLDIAFERRFLYKIRFETPTVEARAQIWQTMLKRLTAKDAKILATKFDLSGGEIENIARKHSVQGILSGKEEINLDEIMESCRQERITGTKNSRIGFC